MKVSSGPHSAAGPARCTGQGPGVGAQPGAVLRGPGRGLFIRKPWASKAFTGGLLVQNSLEGKCVPIHVGGREKNDSISTFFLIQKIYYKIDDKRL